ncbi:thioredoxin family protein [Allorhodopirellula heiligendammensis]|uniref:Thiol-disulfide oxidoreductase ResA n=1 Tax=Allorhodopirellula heiligendammensis TaxID=2714739 RepID=A0A5C6C1N7_9BACT|nr:redoxin domain-containing protein [Allorhodopirellula heiligendammensis]TWU18450.1 Thiol-disulfide oxidoreductase ResA [Allorhodopirellula heiligendammensis]
MWKTGLVAAAWFVLSCPNCRSADAKNDAPSHLGQHVESFTLDNCYGKAVSLDDFESAHAIAIVYLGTECPLAKLYGPRLSDIQRKYADRGVQIIGINSNKQDSLTEMAAYVHRHEIGFPMLKDPGNRVADAMGAQRTPEVFLLDRDRIVQYHGRIDDQYGVGYAKERDAKPELTLAIDALLGGELIQTPETEAVGCYIGRAQEVEPTGNVTFNKDIAPIFNNRCVNCHRDGEIAPFTLTSYDDVLGWEDTILEVIADNRMPPWYADPQHGTFANDARLSETERDLIETWIDNGMPQGDPRDLPAAPEFAVGWQMPQPDEVFPMRDKPFAVPAEGIVDYQHYVVDPGWKEDKYIVAAEARPDKRGVVHHILVYVIPPGANKRDFRQVVAGYAPGLPPLELTDGVALEVKAGSKLLFEMHYTPNGSPTDDRSYLGVKFTDKANVRKRLRGRLAVDQKFKIPPGVSDHEVKAAYVARQDENLISLTPHMHLRGKSFRYDATFPDGRQQTLLSVPNYDFNWQLKYVLKEPLTLPKGTLVQCTAVFDNSEGNMTNPDPSKTVTWGDQSFEEMMIGFMDTVPVTDEF